MERPFGVAFLIVAIVCIVTIGGITSELRTNYERICYTGKIGGKYDRCSADEI